MIRVTIDLIPGGRGTPRTIGMMEIANVTTRLDNTADYAVALKKTPPFEGALVKAWRTGKVLSFGEATVNRVIASEDEEMITGFVHGHHRSKRGVYDLLYLALKACRLDGRLPRPVTDAELSQAAPSEPLHRGEEHLRPVASALPDYAHRTLPEHRS